MDSNELYALTPVPMDQRQSWISLAIVQAGIFICIPSFLLGALLAENFPIYQGILAGVLGSGLTLLLSFILGVQGSDLGIPTCAVCLSTFGRTGTRAIVSSLLALSLIGWFGLQTSVCGEAFSKLMFETFGISIPVALSSVAWGLIMLITAVYGMNALKKLDVVSVPLMLLMMIVGTVMAFRTFGTTGLMDNTVPKMTLLQGISMSFSFSVVAAITSADLTRFQKTRRDTVKSTFWGIYPAAVITLIMGILMTKVASTYDISMVLVAVGIPVFGMLILILSTWTTNSINAYCGGLNLVMTFDLPDNRRRESTMVAGLLGIILAVIGILDYIVPFLSILSYVFSPIGGVMIADYWIVGKGKKENWHSQEGVNWTGVSSTIIGAIGAYLIGIEYVGILIGFLAFLVIERFVPSESRDNVVEKTVEE